MVHRFVGALSALALSIVVGCSSGGGRGTPGDFQLVEFLSGGLDQVARNRVLSFIFSSAVAPGQDLFERIKIQNIQPGANPNFSQALGVYVLNADRVDFFPRLPTRPDRSDAGFRPLANYRVFLKSGPDALVSAGADRLGSPQEFIFDTSEFFDDPRPTEPPRALRLLVRDNTTNPPTDVNVSRQTTEEALESALANTALFAAGQVIEPGGGGGFATPWEFRLECSEPIDPETVTGDSIQLVQVREDALNDANAPRADDGTASFFRVPIEVTVEQSQSPAGFSIFIVVRPLYTLADDARYRLVFGGSVRGLDTRQTLLANNGLTGDGLLVPEPGGAGYAVEFLVFDRGQITTTRTVEFDPLVDGIQPETENEEKLNTAVYSPVDTPGVGIGALQSAFGDGSDQDFSVAGGATVTLNTGDQFNEGVKNNEFLTVLDPNVNDEYVGTPTAGDRTHPNPQGTEFNFTSMTVATGSTLRIVGVNPAIFRVRGVVQISGRVDASGGRGRNGGVIATNVGGTGGPGGFPGGRSRAGGGGQQMCNFFGQGCSTYQNFLNNCAQAQALEPLATNGRGPGRGFAGGNLYVIESADNKPTATASGGGGGGHATPGTDGTDRSNVGGAPGSPGPVCTVNTNTRMSGFIGVRSRGGRTYGDRIVVNFLLGGSGGAGGGGIHTNNGFSANNQAGGSGGGGGGVVVILGRDGISAVGGTLDCSGGDGGHSDDVTSSPTFSWDSISGPGGGGAGGIIALISGTDINLTVAVLDVRGGAGGITLETEVCNNCNDGGDGGRGYIFLMDEDGDFTGFNPGTATGINEFDNFATGVLTVSAFRLSRFGALQASTQLFSVRAANPRFRSAAGAGDFVGTPANAGQTIFIFASSAKADPDDPLLSDGVEAPEILLATITFTGQPTVTIGDDPSLLNTAGDPDRREFVRVRVAFDYDREVEAARGPQATIDRVVMRLDFN